MLPHAGRTQRLAFSVRQLFYPTVAIAWTARHVATALYLLGAASANIDVKTWIPLGCR